MKASQVSDSTGWAAGAAGVCVAALALAGAASVGVWAVVQPATTSASEDAANIRDFMVMGYLLNRIEPAGERASHQIG